VAISNVSICWVCVIFFARVVWVCVMCFIYSRNMSHFWAVFRHIVFYDGFLFPIKELGLLTNPSHWVRVLDVVGSYMYIVL
jgi:hypothetical protein